MTLDEAIRHAEEVAEEQKELYKLCPADMFCCDGTKDCKTLKNGKNKGCQKCAEEHRQLAEWLKELKECRQHTGHWVLVNRGLDIYMCDQCREILQIDRVPIWDYCPVCGVRMGGETDGRPNQ